MTKKSWLKTKSYQTKTKKNNRKLKTFKISSKKRLMSSKEKEQIL